MKDILLIISSQMDSAHVRNIVDQLTHRLVESGEYNSFVAEFSKCSTNYERIQCVYNLPLIHCLIEIKENYRPKSKRHAEVLRAEGNKLFKAGRYQEAANVYTQSIVLAPDDSDNLSLAYNNRSTTNFYMKKYSLCLQDIEMAFLHNYPVKNHYKLFQRIGRCMYYMCRKEEAIQAFQQTIAALDQADIGLEERTVMITDMNKAINQCSSIGKPTFEFPMASLNCCHKAIPKLSDGPSKEVPCLSDRAEIRLDKYGGRGLFAKRDIEIGETLIVETPFASALLKEFNLTHCQYCCNRLVLLLPCKSCSGVVFCSLSCREACWEKFHWAECRVLENIQDSRGDLSFLSSRMILTAGLGVLDEMQEGTGELHVARNAGFNKEGVYQSNDYASAHSLVNHASLRTFQDLLNRTISAVYFLKHLEFVGFFTQKNRKDISQHSSSGHGVDNSEDFLSSLRSDEQSLLKQKFNVGGHILRNIMMLPCNAHEVSEFSLNFEAPAMSATVELAAAIYPVLSLINHSCDPSVVRHSFGNICVARAIRSIKAGEELKDNYGALYPTMDLATRQTNLQSQYFFTCQCEACASDWPQYFNIPFELPVLRCSSCNSHVEIRTGHHLQNTRCGQCGKTQDIENTLRRMSEMEPEYRHALTTVIDGDTSEKNVSTLLSFLQYVEARVHRPWRDINDSQEAFKQCLNMQANCFPSPLS
ncbi:SET and MYND domain-containing protein 4 [Plakobranchus ocellatus]|uniref:Protein-lysine N-methyltransferase SMYD4 n=1 Tax=Plakobranchus ocellatus TaxID=259542 RepID=A0AAV3Y8F9_9GAST|nr:SET and MYND domain-containing protein 4 [Plakobranchus ocellatus]